MFHFKSIFLVLNSHPLKASKCLLKNGILQLINKQTNKQTYHNVNVNVPKDSSCIIYFPSVDLCVQRVSKLQSFLWNLGLPCGSSTFSWLLPTECQNIFCLVVLVKYPMVKSCCTTSHKVNFNLSSGFKTSFKPGKETEWSNTKLQNQVKVM